MDDIGGWTGGDRRCATGRGPRRLALRALAMATAVVLGIGSAAFAGGVSDPGHDGEPHPGGARYRPSAGAPGNVPTLVVVPLFSDAPPPPAMDTVGEVRMRFFGASQSVASYMRTVSDGRLRLVPATESRGASDGIVMAPTGGTIGDYLGEFRDEALGAVRLADSWVDYGRFDADADGRVTSQELLVIMARPPRVGFPDDGGKALVVSDGSDLGTFDEVTASFSIATGGLNTNLATLVHESLHATNQLPDLYGYATGSYALDGPTISSSESHRDIGALSGLHLGWVGHQVADRDGWVEVEPSVGGGDVVLVDDATLGPDGYYILENRTLPPGTVNPRLVYDNAPADRGLLIWKVRDERVRAGTPEHERPIEIMRQDGIRPFGCADEDLDGEVNEDLPGDAPVMDGRVDLNGDGSITVDDDSGPGQGYVGHPVVDGWIDVDRDGDLGDGDDDVTVNDVRIIDGRVDVDDDGRVTTRDDGDPFTGVDADDDGLVDEEKWQGWCYGGSDGDAWDPSDTNFPDRDFLADPADGGTRVAIRNLWPADGDTGSMRAFVDVPGPGVLVDARPTVFDADMRPVVPEFRGGVVRTVDLEVRNTDDPGTPSRRFAVTVEGPAGWTATTSSADLPGDTAAILTVDVTGPEVPVAGPVELTAVATSVDGAALTSRSPLPARLVPSPREPDRFEPNDRFSTHVELDHTHGTTDPLGGILEQWSRLVADLSLHEAHDRDRIRLDVPDFADPADGGHSTYAGHPECGSVDLPDGAQGITSATMDVIVRPDPVHAAMVRTYPGSRTGPQPSRVLIDCPGAAATSVGNTSAEGPYVQMVLSLPHDPDVLPEYEVDATYQWDLMVVPEAASMAREAEEAHGALALLRIPCPGGFFPACGGGPLPQDFTFDLSLQHPANPGRECSNGLCTDVLLFPWAGVGAFEAAFDAPAGFEAELLDAAGVVLASTADGQDDPVLFSHQSTTNGSAQLRLAVDELPAGFYGLRITSEPTTYGMALQSLRTPALQLTHATRTKQVSEAGGVLSRDVTLRNAHPGLALLITSLTDGEGPLDLGGGCTLPITLAPGEQVECEVVEQLGPTPPGTLTRTVVAEGLLDGQFEATASRTLTVDVTDEAPQLVVTATPGSPNVPETDTVVAYDVDLRNPGVEPVTVAQLDTWRSIDSDGDRTPSDGEVVQRDLADHCGLPVTLGPGETRTCAVQDAVELLPWSAPTWRVTARASDDDGGMVGAADAFDIVVDPMTQHTLRPTVDVTVRSYPDLATEDFIEGYRLVPTGRHRVPVSLEVSPVEGPALVETVGFMPSVPADCTVTTALPLVVTGPTLVRGVCLTSEPPDAGLRVAVEVAAGGGTVAGTGRPVAGVRIDVLPDDDDNHVNGNGDGVVPVAAFDGDGFDVSAIEAGDVCFGLSQDVRDCTERHGLAHDAGGGVVLHFDTAELGLVEDADVAVMCLRGTTRDGQAFEGCDTVRITAGRAARDGPLTNR